MKIRALYIAASLVLLAAALPARAGEIIDRIVATVNGHIILQSDWEDAINYEAFVEGRPLDATTPAQRKAALDHLIDQELLREQMREADLQQAASQAAVSQRVSEIRRQYSALGDQDAWQAALTRYNLNEEEVKRRVALQLTLMRLVDERLRPAVQIDARSIESYYQQSLLPQLRQSGAGEVPLAEVMPKIKEVLTQQKLDELLTAWLHNLRSSSEIRDESSGPESQAR